jgi:hypothetical protein
MCVLSDHKVLKDCFCAVKAKPTVTIYAMVQKSCLIFCCYVVIQEWAIDYGVVGYPLPCFLPLGMHCLVKRWWLAKG